MPRRTLVRRTETEPRATAMPTGRATGGSSGRAPTPDPFADAAAERPSEPFGAPFADRSSDPFADLVAALEEERAPDAETDLEVAPADDLDALADLFAEAHGRPRRHPARAPRGSPWPDHNYGEAYHSLRRQRPARRGPRVLSESDVWEVEALTEEPDPGPLAADPEPTPIPWRTPTGDAHQAAHDWLDALDPAAAAPQTTEARIVDLVWGRTTEQVVLDATEVLRARSHVPRVVAPQRERLVPRTVEIGALAVLLVFALAVLQLLLS